MKEIIVDHNTLKNGSVRIILVIFLFLSTKSLFAKEQTYNCIAQEYCQTPLLEYMDGKIIPTCTFNDDIIPERGLLFSTIKVDHNKITIKDRYEKNIEITDFTKGSMSYWGYLDNYEINLVLDDYFELQIREKFSDNIYRNIFYVYGYCNKIQ